MRCDEEDAWGFAVAVVPGSEITMVPGSGVAVVRVLEAVEDLGLEAVVRVSEMMTVRDSGDAAGFAVAEVETAIR